MENPLSISDVLKSQRRNAKQKIDLPDNGGPYKSFPTNKQSILLCPNSSVLQQKLNDAENSKQSILSRVKELENIVQNTSVQCTYIVNKFDQVKNVSLHKDYLVSQLQAEIRALNFQKNNVTDLYNNVQIARTKQDAVIFELRRNFESCQSQNDSLIKSIRTLHVHLATEQQLVQTCIKNNSKCNADYFDLRVQNNLFEKTQHDLKKNLDALRFNLSKEQLNNSNLTFVILELEKNVKRYQSEKNESATIIETLHADLATQQRTVHLCFQNISLCEHKQQHLKNAFVTLRQNVSDEQLKNSNLTFVILKLKQHVKTYQSEKNDSAEIINTLHTDLVAEQRTVHLCFLNFTSCENERLNLKKGLVALHQNVSNEQLKNLKLTDNISSIQFELSLAKLKIHELETEAQLIELELIDTKLELSQIESQKRSIDSNQKLNTVTDLMAESEHTTPFTSVPAR